MKRFRRSFFVIGNCAKNLAASKELMKAVKYFGRGSGHSPLFFILFLKYGIEDLLLRKCYELLSDLANSSFAGA